MSKCNKTNFIQSESFYFILGDNDGGSGYKLSLGEFSKNGTLTFNQQMVNPYTYTQFIVTEEPFQDADPNAASATGGTQLQTPFGG